MSNVLRVVRRLEDMILRVCDGRQRRTKHCWWARFAVRPAKSITNLDFDVVCRCRGYRVLVDSSRVPFNHNTTIPI